MEHDRNILQLTTSRTDAVSGLSNLSIIDLSHDQCWFKDEVFLMPNL